MSAPQHRPQFQLSPRDLLVVLLSVVFGVGTGLLLSVSGMLPGYAVIAGITAAAATFRFFDRLMKSQ